MLIEGKEYRKPLEMLIEKRTGAPENYTWIYMVAGFTDRKASFLKGTGLSFSSQSSSF
jgi:hypothetical protein